MTEQSIKMSHWGKFINSSEIFSLHDHTFTLWLLHYNWPFETQDDWNVLSLAACPQYHDIHPCIHIYSWSAMFQSHAWCTWRCPLPAQQHCWLPLSSGSGSGAAHHATISATFSMLGRVAAQCSDINTQYQRQSFVQSGSPPDAADGAGPGARIQIRIAMQDPALTPGSRSEHLSKWISNRIFNWICVDILLDMLG